MDLSQATAHFGLSAKASATRQGVTWAPRVGPASRGVPLTQCDIVAEWRFTFASPTASVELDATLNYTQSLLGSILSIVVTGVTGTGAGSLNVEYVTSDTVAGMPAWMLASASIRWIDGFWHVLLSGVSQFVMKRPASLPSEVPADWQIHPDGSATGLPQLAYTDFGALPVVASGASGKDFEGEILQVDQTQAICVECTAGRIAFAYGTGVVVLSSGQHFQLGLPGAEGAWFTGGSYRLVSCLATSAASVTLAATEQ